jgi:hypothetical protein
MLSFKSSFAFFIVLTGCFAARAAAPPAAPPDRNDKNFTALTPEEAGPDFGVQGEYSGEYFDASKAKQKLGVQVVALGGGNFRAVFLPGGLPGEGWDQKTTVEIEGQTKNDQTIFKADDKSYSATVSLTKTYPGIAFSGQTRAGELFTLRKMQRQSWSLDMKRPSGAVSLFDGTHATAWQSDKKSDPLLPGGLLDNGVRTKKAYGSFILHLEFRTPFKPWARGQSRGNSGVYIQGRYEVQILDSLGWKLTDKNPTGDIAGEIYKQKAPTVNVCFPPLSWQTYDIDFQAPQWSADGKKLKNAVITVRLNGVLVHDKYEITAKTGAGQPEGPSLAPILLQNHGEPVFFRNIWIIEK